VLTELAKSLPGLQELGLMDLLHVELSALSSFRQLRSLRLSFHETSQQPDCGSLAEALAQLPALTLL
jgi:hypothetical protein